MLHTLIVVIIITLLLLTCSYLSYRQRLNVRNRRLTVTEPSSNRRFYKRVTRDPEEQYIEGVGCVIGDLSCTYNARSPYIRCAINPEGLCQDCHHYQREEH